MMTAKAASQTLSLLVLLHAAIDHTIEASDSISVLSASSIVALVTTLAIATIFFAQPRADAAFLTLFSCFVIFHVTRSLFAKNSGCGCLRSVELDETLVLLSCLAFSFSFFAGIKLWNWTQLLIGCGGFTLFYIAFFWGLNPACDVSIDYTGDPETPILETDIVSFRVDVSNNSSHAIKVHDIVASCNCTRVGTVPRSLQPSKPEEVTVNVEISRYRTQFEKSDVVGIPVELQVQCGSTKAGKPSTKSVVIPVRRVFKSGQLVKFDLVDGRREAAIPVAAPIKSINCNVEECRVSLDRKGFLVIDCNSMPHLPLIMHGQLEDGTNFGPISFIAYSEAE